jgi:ATP-dependent exoDNAse (exonuclease V) beta subunit
LSQALHIYKSSAGSGKTFTLVLTYVSLLLESKDLHKFKKILAVTFTNKAANEMKERVIEALEQLQNQTDKGFTNVYVKKTGMSSELIKAKAKQLLSIILHNYGEFNILTIDKFVHRIIRSFARELGMTSNFELETDIDGFFQRSIDTLLADLGHDDELTSTLIKYSQNLILEDEKGSVESSLLAIVKSIKSEEGTAAMESYKDKSFEYFNEIEKNIKTQIAKLKKDIEAHIQQAEKLVPSQNWDKIGHGGNVGKLLTKFKEGKYDTEVTDSVKKRIAEENWLAKSAEKTTPDLYSMLEANSSAFKDELEQLFETLNQYNFHKLIKSNLVSFSLLTQVQKTLQKIKTEQNIIFISDFNQIISSVVQEESAPFIYEKIGNRFEHYFIDEFQDTSTLQWHNIIPLLFDSLASNHLNLIVGDAKQSIYRFRGGDVSQFVELPRVKANIKDIGFINNSFERNAITQTLDDNYRSSKSVIEFNNAFFENLMAEEEAYFTEIYKDVKQNVKRETEGYVQVNVIEKTKGELISTEEKVLVQLSKNIKDCILDGYQPGDITILTKSKAKGKIVSEHLLSSGFKVVSIDSVVLEQSKAVNCVMLHLEALYDPQEKTILRCFEYVKSNLSLMELFEEYRIPAEKKYYSKDFELDRYLKDFIPKLDKKLYKSLSIAGRVDYLIELFEFKRTDAYIDKLLNLVYDYQKRGTGNVTDFVNLYEQIKSKEAVNVGMNQNAIQMMTIHKSKGLQFPVVMIPFDFDLSPNDMVWVEDEKLNNLGLEQYPLAPTKKMESFGMDNVLNDSSLYRKLDCYNLYYVALTRPEDRLYLTCSGTKTVQNLISTYIQNKGNYNAETLELRQGERTKQNKPIDQKEQETTHFPEVTNWRNTDLELSVSPKTFEADYQSDTEQEIGEAIHHILSQCATTDQVNKKTQEFLLLNYEWKHKSQDLLARLNALTKNKEASSLINTFKKYYSEQAVVNSSGKEIRPDRVNELEDKIILIDYKTGSHHKKYEKQVTEYAQTLEEIFTKPVEKYLIYLSPKATEIKLC